MNSTYNVINSVAAAGGDIALAGGKLSITGAPVMTYKGIDNASILRQLVETLQTASVAWVVANNTTYSFRLTQVIPQVAVFGEVPTRLERVLSEIITYTSDSNATEAEIAGALTAQIVAAGFQITPSGVASPLTLTAITGSPVFSWAAVSNVTITGIATVAIVSSTNATPIVVTTAASTWVVGQTVVITGHLVNTAANGTWRVSATNGTTTVTLEDSIGNGVGGATGTIVKKAQYARGTYAALAARGIVGVTAGLTYSEIPFQYRQAGPPFLATVALDYAQIHTVYVNDQDADYGAFDTELVERLRAYLPGTTDADPNAINLKNP